MEIDPPRSVRIERTLDGSVQRPSAALDEIRHVDTPTEDERRERQPRIGVVGRDPGELLAHTLAPIPLLLCEVLLGGGRVEDHSLLARGDIEDP